MPCMMLLIPDELWVYKHATTEMAKKEKLTSIVRQYLKK